MVEEESDPDFIEMINTIEVQKNDPHMLLDRHYPAARYCAILETMAIKATIHQKREKAANKKNK